MDRISFTPCTGEVDALIFAFRSDQKCSEYRPVKMALTELENATSALLEKKLKILFKSLARVKMSVVLLRPRRRVGLERKEATK